MCACVYIHTHTHYCTEDWTRLQNQDLGFERTLQAKQAHFRELDRSAKKEKVRNRCDMLTPTRKLRNTCSKVLAQVHPHLQ